MRRAVLVGRVKVLVGELHPKAVAAAAVAEVQGLYSKVIYFAAEGALVVAGVVLHLHSMVLAAAEVVDVLQGLYSMALAVVVAVVIAVVAGVLCPKVADVAVAAAGVVAELSERTGTVAAGQSADLDNAVRAAEMTAAVAGDAVHKNVDFELVYISIFTITVMFDLKSLGLLLLLLLLLLKTTLLKLEVLWLVWAGLLLVLLLMRRGPRSWGWNFWYHYRFWQ